MAITTSRSDNPYHLMTSGNAKSIDSSSQSPIARKYLFLKVIILEFKVSDTTVERGEDVALLAYRTPALNL